MESSFYFESNESGSKRQRTVFQNFVGPGTSKGPNPESLFKELPAYVGPPKRFDDDKENVQNYRESNRRQFVEKRSDQFKLRYLFGKVDQAIRWARQLKDQDVIVIYQIIGNLERVITKEDSKLLFLRGEFGQVIQCIFYNIDRQLPEIPYETLIKVTGKMKGSNKMQIFNVDIVTVDVAEESLNRLSFGSQRIVDEIIKQSKK